MEISGFSLFPPDRYFEGKAVYNGTDALDYLEVGEYDGAILDIMMPGMNGVTLLKKLSTRVKSVPRRRTEAPLQSPCFSRQWKKKNFEIRGSGWKGIRKMLHIGCHLSSSNGFLAMGKHASKIGADTFAFFTRNPRGGAAKAIDPADAHALVQYLSDHHFAALVAHAPYTLNPCSPKPEVREFAYTCMSDDAVRMEAVPNQYYNFHPGSRIDQDPETAIGQISDLLNKIMKPEQTTTILLETMSGKGSEVGSTFEELREIIDRVERKDHIGVCLDTCHVYSAGYDIAGDLDGVLTEFDRVIGIDKLKAVHLNDSQTPFASHKDRHEKIGFGSIGFEALKCVTEHPALAGLPFILETPNEDDGYAREIRLLRGEMTWEEFKEAALS